MIEVRQWTLEKCDDTGATTMVCRVKSFNDLRDNIKPLVAMIDAADEGYVPDVGVLLETKDGAMYLLDSRIKLT